MDPPERSWKEDYGRITEGVPPPWKDHRRRIMEGGLPPRRTSWEGLLLEGLGNEGLGTPLPTGRTSTVKWVVCLRKKAVLSSECFPTMQNFK